MRFRSLILIFSVAACDNAATNQGEPDLSTLDDLSMPGDDGGGQDAAAPDLSPLTPSGMIQAVRNAADAAGNNAPDGGQVIMALPVEEAYVTYLKPNVLGQTFDSAGFTVQAEPNGPALFVNVDPASLTPAPKVGDLVSFTVNAVSKNGGLRQAAAISALAVTSSGNSLTAFVQDLSAVTDLVSALDNYESELSKITVTVAGAPFAASGGYLGLDATTAGVTTGGVTLRVPIGLRDTKDITLGCVLSITNTPMWRFNASAEPSAWLGNEVTVMSCPAPQVVRARAVTATTVLVTFDRFLDPATVLAGGFSFDNGLLVQSVSQPAANQVLITTTAAQTAGLGYTVTAAASVKDFVNPVDPAHNSAKFHGFTTPATLQITEFTPGISKNLDLMELKAVSGGSIAGFTLQQDLVVGAKVLANFPDQVVATNDLIVLHIKPSPSPMPTNDFDAKTDCTDQSCYATAWDALGSSDIGNSARVLTIKDVNGNIQDGVAFYNANADADAAFISEMTALKSAGFWQCAAATCVAADATRSNGCGNTAAGKSLKRTGASAPPKAADWPATGLTNSTYGQ